MKLHKGFTLIELLVVVAIMGILASLAMPAYYDYVLRSKVPDATSTLASKRIALEQYFQDNRTYVGAPACNNDTTSSVHFEFSCTNLTANTYTLDAAGKPDTKMDGFDYTIDQNNTKTTTIGAPAPKDWIGNSASCWITKKGGAC